MSWRNNKVITSERWNGSKFERSGVQVGARRVGVVDVGDLESACSAGLSSLAKSTPMGRLGQTPGDRRSDMRLTSQQAEAIRRAAVEAFGPDIELRLFGSRTDDDRRGGDIDLYVATKDDSVERLVRAELDFLVKVKSRIGEQKIDLLLDYPSRRHRPPIFDIARTTGIPL